MLKNLFSNFNFSPKSLSNGLKLICNYQKGSTSCIGLFIKAGSRQETVNNNGVSHFLEHMYFKGTQNQTMEDIEKKFEYTGSLLNAHTSREYQCYSVHCLNEEIELAMHTLSDMILYPKIDKRDINKERETILREFKEVNHSIEEFFYDKLHQLAYPNNPLGFTILGPPQNIQKKITKKKMNKFRDKYYNSNNMVLVGVGNVNENEITDLGNKYFSELPNHNNHLIKDDNIPIFQSNTIKKYGTNAENLLTFAISFEGPGFDKHNELLLLNLIQVIFGFYDIYDKNNFQTSLNKFLLDADKSIRQIFPFCLAYTDRSLFGLYIVNNGNKETNTFIKRTNEKLENLSFSEHELDLAKNFLICQTVSNFQDNLQDVLEEIGRNEIFLSDSSQYDMEKILNFIEKTTINDLNVFWKKYIHNVKPLILLVGDTSKWKP